MDRDSSDEEDDHQTLIHRRLESQSTFHLDDSIARPATRSSNLIRKYIFAITLPLVLIILFISVDLNSLFTGVETDSPSNRMRESELRALYLLNHQRSELLNLLNSTQLNVSSVRSSEEKLRSAVLSQIRLNKRIRGALLSSHRVGNLSRYVDENNEFVGYNGCRRVAWRGKRRKIEWMPKENKYLFAICVSGQTSNHLICLEKHMLFAALLNRTWIIPSSRVDYNYHRILDIDHINECFGRKVVVTFEEFSEMKKGRMSIDRFICYVSSPEPCYVDEHHAKKIKALGVSVAKLEPAWVEDVGKPKKRTMKDVVKKFACDDEVLGVGDLFFANVEKDWMAQPGGPLSHKCKTLIEPSRLIRLTAQRFIQTFLGKNFIALHFRRHGFLKF